MELPADRVCRKTLKGLLGSLRKRGTLRLATMKNMKTAIWDEASRALRSSIPKEDYEKTFSGVQLISFQNGQATLGVKSPTVQRELREKYLTMLEKELANRSGQQVEVQFRLIGQDHSKARRRQSGRYSGGNGRGQSPPAETYLSHKYRFDNFVVGESNKFTHAAAQAVASAPAKTYNPLFIYGGVGLGKTHMMQAIGNHIVDSHQGSTVIYIPAEQFVNEFINAIKRNERLEFQARFRNMDVLLIDDIHFLAGKESTQEEFFHTFNALHNAHKQIIISSDRPPKEIPTIEERLRSRFEWGLITDIQPPDLETRVAILRKKCEEESVRLPDEVTLFIANKVRNSIRELEGSLIKVAAYSSLNNEPVTIEMASNVLREFFSQEDRDVSIEKIIKRVSEHFRVKTQDLLGNSRSRSVAMPRQIAMYLSRELTHHSFPEIGSFFGKKDHSTIMHACRKIGKECEDNEEFRRFIEGMVQRIKNEAA